MGIILLASSQLHFDTSTKMDQIFDGIAENLCNASTDYFAAVFFFS